MPAGESPLVSPGIPQVPFVTGPYKPHWMEVTTFGEGPFACGRSQGPHFPLRVSPLCGSVYAKSRCVHLEDSGS